jgi:hypothetical protein
MFYKFYGDFPSISIILVITLQDRKTLFCVFLSFRDLPWLKLTWDFWRVNILSRETSEEVNETRPRGRTYTGGAGLLAGRATHTRWGLEPPLSSIFVSRFLAWPKNAYIYPLDDRDEWRRRNTKHRNKGCSSEDWRGNIAVSRPQTLLHPLRRQHHHHRHEEWVVHLRTMGLWQ